MNRPSIPKSYRDGWGGEGDENRAGDSPALTAVEDHRLETGATLDHRLETGATLRLEPVPQWRSHCRECLVDVGDEVFDVFDADG